MNTEPYRCRFCQSAFGSAYDKKRHMTLAHREEIEMSTEYACSCGRTFPTLQGRKVHIARASGFQDKHYPIDEGVGVIAAPEAVAAPEEIAADPESVQGYIALLDATPDYRMELIETLAELATWQATLMNRTSIPWADFTWNPTTGCTFGCEWCYARKVADRFFDATHRTAVRESPDDVWCAGDGAVFPANFAPTIYPHRLDEPLRRKKPAVIFLGSMGDVFDPAIPDEFRDRIFATVAAAPQHTFVVLTKRADAMRDYFTGFIAEFGILQRVMSTMHGPMPANLVIGVSVTNQADADERIPLLLDTPAAKRMVSVEPMLGPVSLSQSWRDYLRGWISDSEHSPYCDGSCTDCPVLVEVPTPNLDFVAVGGKTPGKPLHVQGDCHNCSLYESNHANDICERIESCDENGPAFWLRSLRDQCLAAGVPFHYKAGSSNPPLDGVVYDRRP